MNTLVEVREPADRMGRASDLRRGLASGVRALTDALEALGRVEARHEAIRRRRYAALLRADTSSTDTEQPRDRPDRRLPRCSQPSESGLR